MQTNLGGHVHGGLGGTFGLKLNKVKPTLKVDLSGQSSGHLQVQSHPIPRFQLPRTLHQGDRQNVWATITSTHAYHYRNIKYVPSVNPEYQIYRNAAKVFLVAL